MKRLAVFALIACFVFPPTLLAGKGKKKDKRYDDRAPLIFVDDERDAVRLYFVEEHGRGNCPPGLAKKNNGCLPPGQAKKWYRIGHRLPPGVMTVEPPVELTVRPRPCPPGYRCLVADGDLVKLAVGTMLVVDAIQGPVR